MFFGFRSLLADTLVADTRLPDVDNLLISAYTTDFPRNELLFPTETRTGTGELQFEKSNNFRTSA